MSNVNFYNETNDTSTSFFYEYYSMKMNIQIRDMAQQLRALIALYKKGTQVIHRHICRIKNSFHKAHTGGRKISDA